MYSNYLNHHQLSFCSWMDELTNHQFTFVETAIISDERLKLGYKVIADKYPFAFSTVNNPENIEKALELDYSSDVVIVGATPREYALNRAKKGLLTFTYSERLNKKGFIANFSPTTLRYRQEKLRGYYDNTPMYMLCAGTYVSDDFQRLGCFENSCFKWGYFPEFNQHTKKEILLNKHKDKINLLWVGRLIDWKHPEFCLDAATVIKRTGIPFTLNIIGEGNMREKLSKEIIKQGLEKEVFILGPKFPEEIRKYMLQSDIFLMTSDSNEGWGAVINEAMNEGCAVIASHAAGAAGVLIENGINGLLFENENREDFVKKVLKLSLSPELREALGIMAYKTIFKEWNPETAPKNFMRLSEDLLKNKKPSITDGPCSIAERITPKDIAEKIIIA